MSKTAAAAVILCCCLRPFYAEADDAEKRRRKQRERIEDLAEKLGRRIYTYPDIDADQKWLHQEASVLLERTKKTGDDAYRFDRLARATDALLEASERILESREEEDHDEDDKEEAARGLERDYFRLQQAEYFAQQKPVANAGDYLKLSRSIYQQARWAYDKGLFDRAKRLGNAASYVARALEYLAQAVRRVPEPPRLEP